MEKKFLTPAEAAEILGVKEETVLSYIKTGELEAEPAGNHYKIAAEDFELFKELKNKGIFTRSPHRCKGTN